RDQCHGHAGGGTRGGDDRIENRLWRSVEQMQTVEFKQSFGFVHGAFQGWGGEGGFGGCQALR
ncbi:hypothetical protein, partial [Enterococcus faecium]